MQRGGSGAGGAGGDAQIAFAGQQPARIAWPASQLELEPCVTACLNAGAYGRAQTAS